MSASSRSYKTGLYRRLQNDVEARNYLQAALDDSRSAFLVALRNVAEARNLSRIARNSSLNRVNVYRMLSESGNPTLDSLEKILRALGLRIAIDVEEPNKENSSKEKAAFKNEWHTVWCVASDRRKVGSYYTRAIHNLNVSTIDIDDSEVMGFEHAFAAAGEDPYFQIEHPVSLQERELEDCYEMAY